MGKLIASTKINKRETYANAKSVMDEFRPMRRRAGLSLMSLKSNAPISFDKTTSSSNGFENALVNEVNKREEAERFCRGVLQAVNQIESEVDKKILFDFYVSVKPMSIIQIMEDVGLEVSQTYLRRRLALLEFAQLYQPKNLEVFEIE